jgi:hypothetical protein
VVSEGELGGRKGIDFLVECVEETYVQRDKVLWWGPQRGHAASIGGGGCQRCDPPAETYHFPILIQSFWLL